MPNDLAQKIRETVRKELDVIKQKSQDENPEDSI
jgi:hypothetical protein